MTTPTAQSGPSALLAAIRTVHQLHDLGDAIYSVRSRAVESGELFDGDSWDHPDVKAYSDAVKVITDAIAGKEPPAGARDAVVAALIETTRSPDGSFLPCHAEPWGIDVGLVNKAIEALTGKADGGDVYAPPVDHAIDVLENIAHRIEGKSPNCADELRQLRTLLIVGTKDKAPQPAATGAGE